MYRLALKNAVANRSRFALTALAVVLAVGFLTSTLILTDSLAGTASSDVAAANADLDAVVEGVVIGEIDGGPGEVAGAQRRSLPGDTVAAVSAVDGVDAAVSVTSGFARLVDDGVAVGTGLAADVGTGWITNPLLNPFTIVDGTPPEGTGEVAIDRAVADEAGIVVGDHLEVLTASGLHEVTVSGIATYGGGDRAPFQRTTLFAPDASETLLGVSTYSQVRVAFVADADDVAVLDRIESTVPEADVSTGAQFTAARQDAVASPLTFMSVFLTAFAGIATVVGVTIIYNTFAIAIAQRRRELALMRAIGAERRQVLRSLMLEAALVGTVSTGVGIGVGIVGVRGLRAIMSSLGMSLLSGPVAVSAMTVAISAAVGILVTLGSALAPARGAASAAPVEALRNATTEPPNTSRIRVAVGGAALVGGVGGLVAAVIASSATLLATMVLIVPGLVLAGPSIVDRVGRWARPVMRSVRGVEGAIAATNLARNPRRSASTTLALTLGVALVGFFSILASTLTAAVSNDVEAALTADHVVTSASPEFPSIDPGLADRLATIDGVSAVAPVSQTDGTVDGSAATIAGIDASAMLEVFQLDVTKGSIDALHSGGVAVVQETQAAGVAPGDTVVVELDDTTVTLPVVAIVGNSLGGFDAPTHFVARHTLAAGTSGLLDNVVYLRTDSVAAVESVRAEVADTPGSIFRTRASYIAGLGTEVDAFRNAIYAMLGLTLLIAMVGIANTTTLSVSERIREIGLLRAVGATTAGIRRIIRYEAALLAAVGAVTGLVIALGGSYALVTVTGGAELPSVAVPWLTLSLLGLGAVVAGTGCAAVPAWRASRRPILEATAA